MEIQGKTADKILNSYGFKFVKETESLFITAFEVRPPAELLEHFYVEFNYHLQFEAQAERVSLISELNPGIEFIQFFHRQKGVVLSGGLRIVDTQRTDSISGVYILNQDDGFQYAGIGIVDFNTSPHMVIYIDKDGKTKPSTLKELHLPFNVGII